ncbi:MAG: hypothetical protein HC898_05245, partial [Phycisphaerales bacterium]|nr:hypothetical protein [Phycisphaerales bacterium]
VLVIGSFAVACYGAMEATNTRAESDRFIVDGQTLVPAAVALSGMWLVWHVSARITRYEARLEALERARALDLEKIERIPCVRDGVYCQREKRNEQVVQVRACV